MRNSYLKSITALSTGVVLFSIVWTASAQASWLPWSASTPDTAQPVANQVVAKAATSHDGTFQGGAYDAYWGQVQVEATIQNGTLVSVNTLVYPDHRNTSRSINRRALPLLQKEVIQAQSIRVNLISGATLTSQAYLRSLRSALKSAGY